MRTIIILFCFLTVIGSSYAQENQKVLYANEHNNTLLLFPAPIKQAVTGSENFLFSYSSEHPEIFGLLKARPGIASNLIVVTGDGAIYSFILQYKDSLPFQHYLISSKDQLKIPGKAVMEKGNQDITPDLSQKDIISESNSFNSICKFYLQHTKGIVKSQRTQGLILKVLQVVHREGEVFVVTEIKNNSSIDLEIAGLDLFMLQGNRRKNSSFQKILLKPIFEYNKPETIRKGHKSCFVLVYPKFTTGSHDRLQMELQEAHGNRSVRCKFRY